MRDSKGNEEVGCRHLHDLYNVHVHTHEYNIRSCTHPLVTHPPLIHECVCACAGTVHRRSRWSGKSGYSIYVATPSLVSSACNTVRCLKPNGLGTRPQSSIPYNYVYVRISYACERNLSKKEAHGSPGPAILVHLELAVQSTKVPREPILKGKNVHASHGLISTTHLYSLPPAACNFARPSCKSLLHLCCIHAHMTHMHTHTHTHASLNFYEVAI